MTDNQAAAAATGSTRPGGASQGGAVRRPGQWIRTFHPRPGSRARLLCFPHAGGPAMAFTSLSAALPEDVELLAVQYPGRQDRRSEPFAESVTALARGAVEALRAQGHDDKPLFVLGHSMGSIVAFEATRILEAEAPKSAGPAVVRLFASAAAPPSARWHRSGDGEESDEAVVKHVRWLGGVPEALLDDAETVREMVRLLRGDNEALRGYHCAAGAAVAAPLTALLADDDPKNSAEETGGWARHTTGEFAVETTPGGHFSLTERDSPAVAVLTRRLREDLHRLATAAGGDEQAGSA
ncbi:thioesterase II family protein [Streptomyces sp. XD-27]|uniref:thioesterase II family protein n=1 Tax=Streptomyces sp. XD-27 TaxID=3062779 RepID=UPI0026F44813|nr:alpha/beta fold hydrolase [Streptomyces sp. XD-27]WKX68654.1 alpha/beta fold hydrolase [Streptomyces sp. XD-27]